MITVLTQSHLLLIRYLNHPVELIFLKKNSITLGAIISGNKTQHQFSNLSLKTFSPTKLKFALKENALENINEEVKSGNFN